MAEEGRPLAVVESQIEVNASPEVLWTCFADLGRWAHWFPALIEAEWVAGSPWTLGSRFRQSVRFGFPLGKVGAVVTVVEISPAPYVAWEGNVMGMGTVQGYRFDATNRGTRVLSRHEFYGGGALLARVCGLTRRVQRLYSAALEGLRAYVETGTIQLRMPM